MSYTSLFHYAGGKYRLLDDIFEIFNQISPRVVVEPFGGSAKFLLNVAPSDLTGKKILVYNDRDGRMVNLFTMMRDNPKELYNKFDYAVISRRLHFDYMEDTGNAIEDAFRELYVLLTSYAGHRQNFFHDYTYQKLPSFENFRNNMLRVHEIIRHWIIESLDYVELIKKWDSPDTMFYLDPPYIDTSYYRYNFNYHDFTILKNTLYGMEGHYLMNVEDDARLRQIFGEPQYAKEYRNETVTDRITTRVELFYTNLTN